MPARRGKLAAYDAKRDFAVTAEPAGAVGKRREKGRRFVIQKHDATRLHYDLRLEHDGVYKSWAVTKGPSLDPREKRLAVAVEDHPLDYGTFEGIIPKGQYGGGTVMLWDRGTWEPEGDVDFGLGKGHLAFRLKGEKLDGGWHLVRLKPRGGEKRENWLLMKVDDAAARDGGDVLVDAPDSVASGRSMAQIAAAPSAVWETQPAASPAKRRPRPAKRSAAPARRGTGAPTPGFIAPQLATLAEDVPHGDDIIHEIKFDGYRLIVRVDGGTATVFTRNGLDWTERFPGIAAAAAALPVASAVLDGEAVINDAQGVSSFALLQAALGGRNPKSNGRASAALFEAFDLLWLDGDDLRERPLLARKAALAALLAKAPGDTLRYTEHLDADGEAMVRHACRLGLEGIICKRGGAPYRSGRGRDWLKVKCHEDDEFVVGGFVPASDDARAIGSLVVGRFAGGELRHEGRVGTGYTNAVARRLFATLDAQRLPAKQSAFAPALSREAAAGVVHVAPQLVARVAFRGRGGNGLLRHAAFKGLREDKTAAEVTLAAAPVAAPTTRKPVPQRGGVQVAGLALTHPERVLWPDTAYTKQALAEYYAAIAPHVLPHVAGRPLSLLRCPDGSGGKCFFQKHAFAGLRDAVRIVELADGDGAMQDAIVVDSLAGIVALVQASVLEIHPWGSLLASAEQPDRIIFDLDPGDGVGWAEVCAAAHAVGERLETLGFVSFVKTSGGKGLHVVAPLQPAAEWPAVKAFCKRLADAMAKDEPKRYTATLAKKARAGRIFIDYLRNGRGQTAVAAFSTRARAGAPVSLPVAWGDVSGRLDPAAFTLATVPGLLAARASDPWAAFAGQTQAIPRA